MKHLLIFSLSVCFITFCINPALLFADETENSYLPYTRLGVDKKGESYFKEERLELNAWPSGLAMTSLEEQSENIRFFKAKQGWQMLDLHHAPKRQYLLVLQGVMEILTSTGQKKQFKQGSILLVEDTYGKGHRTRSASKDALILAWVGIGR